MSFSRRSLATLQLCVLSLLSAFLLFQVQPVISKFILPWFGGSPGVWTTCMLFFQVVLFLGYAYAHALTKFPRRWQGWIHAILVIAAALSLPIAPGERWKPSGSEDPTHGILLLLLANVALPYFVLSSTSPLVQVWFSRATGGQAPWRLYALSNLGSLAALLSYPFFFEPRWDVMQQTWMWAGGFAAFAVLSLLGAYSDRKEAAVSKGNDTLEDETTKVEVLPPLGSPPVTLVAAPAWWHRVLWLLLPAVASVLLLASTNHLCQDVAVIPFLWVLPLSLYLLTFIICFEHERWYVRWAWAALAIIAIFAAAVPEDFSAIVSKVGTVVLSKVGSVEAARSWSWSVTKNFHWEIGLICTAIFLGCMICHGELARLKPHPSRLTEFYLTMSAGGALGGLFVSLAAPRLFTTYMEWPGVLFACISIGFVILVFEAWRSPKRWLRASFTAATAVLAGIGVRYLSEGESRARVIFTKLFPVFSSSLWSHLLFIAFVTAAVGIVLISWLGRERWSRLIATSSVAAFAGTGVWWVALNAFSTETRLETVRNFYGVISVEDDYDDDGQGWRTLYHGSILHGRQFLSEAWDDEPLSYYGHETGIGKALLSLKDRPDARVGIVGMGAGTVAAYAQKDQVYRFYDINPDIVRLAKTRFRYLKDLESRGAKLEIALGDARLSLEHEESQHFDVLLLDAFSGDSVPVHLLTREAFEIYQRHMKPDGIIAVHVSNRYLALAPVIKRVADSVGMRTTRVLTDLEGFDEATDYVLVTNNQAFLMSNAPETPDTEEPAATTLWTDRRHNLFECLLTD